MYTFIPMWSEVSTVRVLVALTLGLLLYICVKNYLLLQLFKKRGIPGPKPTLFIGNFAQLRSHGRMPHETIAMWIAKYGNVFGMFYGPQPSLVINEPEVLKEVMIRHFSKFTNRIPIAIPVSPLSESIFFNRDDRWRASRHLLTPAFSSNKLKLLTKAMNEETDVLVEVLGKVVDENIDFVERFQALTLDVIGKCALGFNVDCQKNPRDSFLLSVRNYIKYSSNPVMRLAVALPLLSPPLMFFNKYLAAGKFSDMIVGNLKHIISMRTNDNSNCRMDLLQLMLDAEDDQDNINDHTLDKSTQSMNEKRLTEKEIIGNSYIFLIAGYETSAATLGFAFYLLANHPKIQDILFQEISCKLKDVTCPTYEEVFGLTYLDQVLNETLRLFPPVPHFVIRHTNNNIKIGDVFIPKGVIVQAPVWQLHHDPQHWTNPEIFDPERFNPTNRINIKTGTFLPFGIGPRNCIGFRFAQLEMKLAVIKVLKSFKIVPSSKTEMPLQLECPSILLRAKNGVVLKLQARNETKKI